MATKTNKHIGSGFDDFLEEEGVLDETEAVAAKRVYVFQLEKELRKQKLKKSDLAERMHTSRSSIERLLDPSLPSTLKSLSGAAIALGKHLRVRLA
ncbi:MAG: XRE family transcriptional regulator [Waddliaceae bacterium]|jgi:antitoxin HicB|nr:XRE family transcriptional regulator [Waddliaceae bacterium]MBT6928871.1 XRE family transcriptional regulator [Waddliaceae bacterium]